MISCAVVRMYSQIDDFNSSLYFYKPLVALLYRQKFAQDFRDICGPSLKAHLKNGKKIYMRQTIGKLHWEMG